MRAAASQAAAARDGLEGGLAAEEGAEERAASAEGRALPSTGAPPPAPAGTAAAAAALAAELKVLVAQAGREDRPHAVHAPAAASDGAGLGGEAAPESAGTARLEQVRLVGWLGRYFL